MNRNDVALLGNVNNQKAAGLVRSSQKQFYSALQSLQELVILRVCPNPEPNDKAASSPAQSTIILVHTHRPDIFH